MEVKTCYEGLAVTVNLLNSLKIRACDLETEGPKVTVAISNLQKIMEVLSKPQAEPEIEITEVRETEAENEQD